MSKAVKCPRLGCNGVGIPIDTEKKFSFGKAIVGNTVGVCSKCGKVFEKKV